MNIQDAWKKAGLMDVSTIQYIHKKVYEQTGFKVVCQDTRNIDLRKNVGLVIPKNASTEALTKAEDVFIAAAKDKGITIERQNIVRYAPNTISPPSRNINP